MTSILSTLPNVSVAREARVKLANGFEAILIEDHATPMVSSVITVRTGVADESYEYNGVSHMLEHLLFNGTDKRTQEELYEETDYYGLYINAHTGNDFTNYIGLAANENAERMLDIQSDMLFHSTIPAKKFEKEKGIILNEIARDMSQPHFVVQEQFNRNFFSGTPYNLPVIGIPERIKEIKRKTVLDYYKTHYLPNRMTALIMGDFDPIKMVKTLNKFFGEIPPGLVVERQDHKLNPKLFGTSVESSMKVQNTSLTFGMPLPSIQENDFYSLTLMAMLLDSDLKQRLNVRLRIKDAQEILNASASVDFNRDMAFFFAELTFPPGLDSSRVKKIFEEEVKDFANRAIDKKRLEELLVAKKVQEILLYEKPHYFGMIKGIFLAAGGWEFTKEFPAQLEKAFFSLQQDLLKKYFSNALFFTSLVKQGEKSFEDILGKIEKEYYRVPDAVDSHTAESVELIREWAGGNKEVSYKPIGKGDHSSVTRQGEGEIKRLILDNSLTLIVSSNPFSKVFAVHLLAKNRSHMEPEGKTGIADFLHRLLKKGTSSLKEDELNQKLDSIGAKLKTHDNPYIPYDNHYTTHEHSYVRFESIDDYTDEAVKIFTEIISAPRFNDIEIEQVRKEMLGLIRESQSNPSKLSAGLMDRMIFGDLPQGKNILGTEDTIKSITRKDLEDFYRLYFSPQNLIVSVATSHKSKEIIDLFKKETGSMRNAPLQTVEIDYGSQVTKKSAVYKEKLGKPQAYFRTGKFFKIRKSEKAGLRVLGSILSNMLSTDLREKQGIAYSLGAGFRFYDEYALLEIGIGTTLETLENAENGIEMWLNKMPKIDFTEKEISRIVNKAIARGVMRKLTRISQCYYLGVEDFYNLETGSHNKRINDLKNVTPAKIKRLAVKYLGAGNMVKVIVE